MLIKKKNHDKRLFIGIIKFIKTKLFIFLIKKSKNLKQNFGLLKTKNKTS